MASYYVSKAGNDSNNGTTWALAKLTIAGAIAVSTTGDTINIGAGSWTGSVDAARTFRGVSMFQTSVTYNMSTAWFLTAITFGFENIRINFTGTGGCMESSNITVTNSYLDFTGLSTTYSSLFYTCNITATRSIVTKSGGWGTSIITSSTKVVTIDHCCFGLFGANTYFIASLDAAAGLKVSVTNTIAYCSYTLYVASNSYPWLAEQYNCFYGVSGTGTSGVKPGGALSATDVLTNPLFVDASGGDFRLQSTSPCIGTGHA